MAFCHRLSKKERASTGEAPQIDRLTQAQRSTMRALLQFVASASSALAVAVLFGVLGGTTLRADAPPEGPPGGCTDCCSCSSSNTTCQRSGGNCNSAWTNAYCGSHCNCNTNNNPPVCN
jgi:hypothetical protein